MKQKILLALSNFVNFLLLVVYLAGGLVLIVPDMPSSIPQNLGNVAVGILLIVTSMFGRPFVYAEDFTLKDELPA